ncbi:class I SAM-dependent methyltransferase [Pontibacter arcticus]|uniref:SAM-dependent methyltransferase n=1 Tax=Pontibacter arcticus TaxID=2080288 RepID=A0A364RJ87_9BACT|nr:class I SAM-dependent methyltransferase [Pontibacter arcticus]RAU84351.1 SAM-dependent methyltransferase [Pontibacter arcticus]
MKDNFSGHAADYAKFRPSYPRELIAHLVSIAPAHHLAWDCATGNGQVAVMLSEYFGQVIGTDISENQLKNATQHPNILYKTEQAENASFEDNSVDLVVVAQAVHWFNFDLFYAEAKRVLKPGGVIAILGYGLLKTQPKLDEVIHMLYDGLLSGYWDPERRYLDENYQTIPFPFEELNAPHFEMTYTWRFEELVGYLNTWSAVKHYEKANGQNPLELLHDELKATWGDEQTTEIRFEVLTRIGKV